jgi:transcriptional regulator with XRE-family HTH domain
MNIEPGAGEPRGPSSGVAAIGATIRRIRAGQGLTLKALAGRSGVSIATISKIERGKITGGFETIYKIARGLGVLVTDILAGDAPDTRTLVRHAADRSDVHTTAIYDYFPQAARRGGALNPYVMVIHTREIPERRDWSIREGEEVVIVLSGAIELHVEGEAVIPLGEGDSACFDCGRRHCFVATGRGPARIVSVSTRPAGFSKLKASAAAVTVARGGRRRGRPPGPSSREEKR